MGAVMKMVSLKQSQEEREESMGLVAPSEYRGPEYPYGTQLDLRGETLDKLGIELGDVEIDQEFTLTAKCCVTRMSSSESTDGEPRQEMTLQLKEIALSADGKSIGDSVRKILARRFNGGGEGGESDGDE